MPPVAPVKSRWRMSAVAPFVPGPKRGQIPLHQEIAAMVGQVGLIGNVAVAHGGKAMALVKAQGPAVVRPDVEAQAGQPLLAGQHPGALQQIVGEARAPVGRIQPQGVDVEAVGTGPFEQAGDVAQFAPGDHPAQDVRRPVQLGRIGQEEPGEGVTLAQHQGVFAAERIARFHDERGQQILGRHQP